jgi:ribosomal protein S5
VVSPRSRLQDAAPWPGPDESWPQQQQQGINFCRGQQRRGRHGQKGECRELLVDGEGKSGSCLRSSYGAAAAARGCLALAKKQMSVNPPENPHTHTNIRTHNTNTHLVDIPTMSGTNLTAGATMRAMSQTRG